MFKSTGKLKYFNDPYKMIVEVDNSIVDYYRSLVPKHITLNRPRYAPHITVVRKETPINLEAWEKFQNEEVDFFYEGLICNDDTYYWLGAYCPRLEQIRIELGLPCISWVTQPPDGGYCFHITIGNTKSL